MKIVTVFCLGLVALGSTAVGQSGAPNVPVAATRLGAGYLQPGEGPDSGKMLPPPPVEGSKALAQDEVGERQALRLRGTARWDLAKVDADIFSPNAISVMSCAAGRVIGVVATPKTNALLRKASADLGLSTYPAKTIYKRPRPFIGNGQPICTPAMIGVLTSDGSYPSGHAAIGYGWGTILGDLLPKRRRALFKRGAAFADSRRVCNVHFRSDIAAGEILANAVVMKLRANPVYQADLAAAQAELTALAPISSDCVSEKAALRLTR